MKNHYSIIIKKTIFFFLILFITANLFAQKRTITGTVISSDDNTTLPGVSVVVKGTTIGTITDIDGKYSLEVPENATNLIFTYIGMVSEDIEIGANKVVDLSMVLDIMGLDEIVVIGYGTTRKGDATGSVTAISVKDFNKGSITSPQELLMGKTAGVQITTGGGAPGEKATIRIRGGSSLKASNDPLIVIDGVPIDNEDVNGMRNPLSTIHPNDIETFTVLKDASATAIYGSRASNGVIIITTKKGRAGKPLKLNYTSNVSIYTIPNKIDVPSADKFRTIIKNDFANDSTVLALLGDGSTNWQDEVFQTAIGHDHNLSATGSIKNLPYRVSLGYTNQDGVLKTSEFDRTTLSIGLNPSFLDDHLKVNINVKGMNMHNRFPDQGAIGSAIRFDPTKPVFDEGSIYGGYYAWTNPNDSSIISMAGRNPVAQLELREDLSTVNRSIGNLQLDYKFHFLPELKANLNVGYDYSKSDGTIDVSEFASWSAGGEKRIYDQNKKNELLDFYFNYVKDLNSIDSKLDAMAGYSWQHFWRKGSNFGTKVDVTDTITPFNDYATENYLVSFFTRINYTFKEKYLFTFTLRDDGSSRFAPENRWGLFPSVALAWKIKNESFLKNVDVITDLKLRLGFGITGQQNITTGDYPYLASYTYGETSARYQFGDEFVTTLRPEGYDIFIKWEETKTYNIGLDYGLINDRIFGAFDLYYRETNDLINEVPVAAGTNLTNIITTNVGDLENKGVEFSIVGRPIVRADMFWELGFNFTYNVNKITKLTIVDNPDYLGIFDGGISGGVGNTIQIHSVGYSAYSFFVYEQIYDENGNPIEGLYVDRNNDGEINSEDMYRFENPAPDVFMGFSSRLEYKNFDFTFAGRVNIGNYMYNNISSTALYNDMYIFGTLNNIPSSAVETKFHKDQFKSDYFIQNASFLRMDNITLGYNFEEIYQEKLNVRLSVTVQNAFVITKYTGLDPEIFNGIDNNIYPRPRTFVLGLSIDF
ncbi:MAG: TonB-dependent receptor [Bacteroidales bacterium]|nr:TonB-dependent receptor [Bacteroidales bacterium]